MLPKIVQDVFDEYDKKHAQKMSSILMANKSSLCCDLLNPSITIVFSRIIDPRCY